MSPHKFLNTRNLTVGMLVILALSFGIVISGLQGCLPPPPLEDNSQQQVAPKKEEPSITPEERMMMIKKYRSFAYQAWKNKDYEKACRHLDTVRVYDIDHTETIYRSWADCFYNLGKLDSVLVAYEEGIKYFPDDDYLRNSLAIMYLNEGRIEEAIEQQIESIRIKPDDSNYIRSLADLYLKIEDYDKVIETLQRLAELKPDDAVLNQELLNLIKAQRDPEEFLKELAEAVKNFPDDPPRRFAYASGLLDQGQNEKAAEQFVIYTKAKKDDVKGWRGLAKARDNLAQYEQAISAHRKVVDLEPGALKEMVSIGQNYLALKRLLDARSWAQKALAKNPNFGPAWMLMGDVYSKAADVQAGETPKYNDKLVFVIAYGLYERAANSPDPRARSQGDREMRILTGSELVPTKEDRFMHMRETRPTGEVYKWINHDWNEVKYIDKFLKKLDES